MKINISEFLKIDHSDLTSDRIVFLLGAGASIDAGIPTLSKMTDDFELYLDYKTGDRRKSVKHKYSELKRLYQYFKKESYSTEYSLHSSANVENILALVNDFLSLKAEKKLYNIIGNWDKDLLEITGGHNTKIVRLKKTIEEYIHKRLNWQSYNGDVDCFEQASYSENLRYIYFLFYLQTQLGGNMRVFSLNHDRVIEEAYEQFAKTNRATTIELQTGVFENRGNKIPRKEFSVSKFTDLKNGKLHRTNGSAKQLLQLFKLHGSIDWKKEGETNKIYVENTSDSSSEMIFGISQKFKSDEPYNTLYYKFKEAIQDRETLFLIVAGYSFNDKHINDAISTAVAENPKLHIIISDPSLCETGFFSYPVSAREYPDNFLKKVISSNDYESYMNMSFMLHSVYYSRNYEEEALFLAYCKNKGHSDKNPLKLTPAGRSAQELKESIKLINSILNIDDFEASRDKKGIYETVKKTFNDPAKADFRNGKLYSLLDTVGKKEIQYNEVIKTILEIKVALYKSSNSPEANRTPYEKFVAKEIIDEIRVIEQFIRRFIPVHLGLLFALIEELKMLERVPQNKPKRISIEIAIFELYLKYNYLVETLLVKLAEAGDKDLELLTDEKLNLIDKKFSTAFRNLIKEGRVVEKIREVNAFLKNVKSGILQTSGISGSTFVKQIEKLRFEDYFLTATINNTKTLKTHCCTFLKSVLHETKAVERIMKLRVMLYSKAIMKSMTSRLAHIERLGADHSRLVSQLEARSREEVRKRYKPGPASEKIQGEIILKFIDGLKIDEKFFGEIFNSTESGEMRNKLDINLNWYVNRYAKIIKEFIKGLFVIRFDDADRDYTNNLKIYFKLLQKEKNEDGVLYKAMLNAGFDSFIKNYEPITKEINSLLEKSRITVKHFSAKIFFSKDLRPTNLFKYYHSRFNQEEHVKNFGNVDKVLRSFWSAQSDIYSGDRGVKVMYPL